MENEANSRQREPPHCPHDTGCIPYMLDIAASADLTELHIRTAVGNRTVH